MLHSGNWLICATRAAGRDPVFNPCGIAFHSLDILTPVKRTVISKAKEKKAILQGLNTGWLPAARVEQINQFLQSTTQQQEYIDDLDPELYATLETSPKNYFYPGGYQKPAKSPYEPVFSVR